MDSRPLLMAAVLSVFFFGAVGGASVAFAQYQSNYTLDEILRHQPLRISPVDENRPSGPGTPYLDVHGAVGASVIAGAVFGGAAAAFFIRGRSGKYVATGRG